MCCAVCLTDCVLVFPTFFFVAVVLLRYSSRLKDFLAAQCRLIPHLCSMKWIPSWNLEFTFIFLAFFTRFCSIILKYTPKSSPWTLLFLLIHRRSHHRAALLFYSIFSVFFLIKAFWVNKPLGGSISICMKICSLQCCTNAGLIRQY